MRWSWSDWRIPAALGLGLLILLLLMAGVRLLTDSSVPVVYSGWPAFSEAIAARRSAPAVRPSRTAAQAGEATPTVTIIVIGLGLAESVTRAAIDLPPAIGLAFSAYADAAPGWRRLAREAGHEVLTELPLEPRDTLRDDTGPLTLRVDASDAERLDILSNLVESSGEPMGLVMAAGRFADRPATLDGVIGWMADRRLTMVELDGSHLADSAARRGATHLRASGPLDADLRPEAIDAALQALAEAARRSGRAVGYVRPYPVSLTRIGAWARSLGRAGLLLASPVEAFGRALPTRAAAAP